MSKKINDFLIEFCNDSIEVLKKQDKIIGRNIKNSTHNSYYEDFPKGIFIKSITEPILKFMIFSSLVRRYKMFPEAPDCYKGKKLLDLAIYSPQCKATSIEDKPDIAIEMKWGGVKATSELSQWSLNSVRDDILKLHRGCTVKHKYAMQFIVLKNDNEVVDANNIRIQILTCLRKRRFKKDIQLVYCNFFSTKGFDKNEKWRFYLVLWRIND